MQVLVASTPDLSETSTVERHAAALRVERLTLDWDELVSFLSRAFGVRPRRPYAGGFSVTW